VQFFRVRSLGLTGGRGGLARRLGGQLLPRCLAAGGLAGSLLRACHRRKEVGGDEAVGSVWVFGD
jgi:hypothetical protein